VKILLVSYYNPLGKGGFEKQTFGLMKSLFDQGHELSCLTIAGPENHPNVESELHASGIFKLGYFVISHAEIAFSTKAKALFWLNRNPAKFLALQTPELLYQFQEKIHEISNELSIDLIHCLGLRTSYFLPNKLERPVVLDFIDSMTLRKTRKLKGLLLNSSGLKSIKNIAFTIFDLLKTYKIERDILYSYPQCPITTLSPVDRETLKRIKNNAYVQVIPSATLTEDELDSIEVQPDNNNPPVLVFYGYLVEHNYDALCFLVDEIMPIVVSKYPETKLLITGFNIAQSILDLEKKYTWINIYQSVEDINSFISRATILCFPFRTGCGVKTKILECMALSKPIVTTTIGAEALLENQKQGLLIADKAEKLINHIIYLVENHTERTRLGEINRQVALKDFTWEKKSQEFLKVYTIAKNTIDSPKKSKNIFKN
jgi:glycosyltransferase involved in cell wall biosynthesis